jgi:hypothetical protein
MATVSIECLVCATPLEFRPGDKAVVCPICEEPRPLPLRLPDQLPRIHVGSDQPWQATLAGRTVASCSSCAAIVSAVRALDRCPHCRAPLTRSSPALVMAAHGYLPFLLDANAASAALQRELSRLSLTGGAQRPEPLYVPWLLVSCHVRGVYEGKVGYVVDDGYDPVTNARRTRMEWTQAVGAVERPWENVGGCPSPAMPAELSQRLLPWDFAFAEPIAADSLGPIATEHVRFEPAQVFTWAVPECMEELRNAALEDMQSSHRVLHGVHPERHDESVVLILVPVWLGTTSNGQRWAVNARTGEVVVSGHAGLEPEEATAALEPDRARYVRLGLALAGVAGLLGSIAWLMMG